MRWPRGRTPFQTRLDASHPGPLYLAALRVVHNHLRRRSTMADSSCGELAHFELRAHFLDLGRLLVTMRCKLEKRSIETFGSHILISLPVAFKSCALGLGVSTPIFAAFTKETLQNCRALLLQNAGCNIAPVIQCRHL